MNTNKVELSKGIEILNSDGIIAIPTETVYGLAGNAFSEVAVSKIFALKKRPHNNPLIVHIGSIIDLDNVALEIPKKAYALMEAFWPGPLTLVLKKHPNIPHIVTAGNETVAVRMPNHAVALEVLNQLDFPLAAPSANRFGGISPTSAAHVANSFGFDAPFILDGGECERGLESTIVGFDGEEPILYRYGSVSAEDIEKICGKLKVHNNEEVAPQASGMLSKHYAPKTKTFLTDKLTELAISFKGKKIGLLLFSKKMDHINCEHQEVLSDQGDLAEAAKNLYAAMHRLDSLGLDFILAEEFPNVGMGKTINDRLQRASK
ncbi:threonylcarbamoyl-AMP synthase [Pedobacter changchengzhani]|uniref:Threonylcarbamoyl-AMP synthase n=1 Tax=Pedobacter changchengzhani TaxID=2529274 RepID=A0A4R5MLS8_9SPHI|nr:L-threonylcarbamoyladenylate synthase [Pedobacter changchengzhani]TDG36205.1 threonylcarbamoyl-AMP synthase [Pedobacter changchengzhani]